jgi:hypothetical protein
MTFISLKLLIFVLLNVCWSLWFKFFKRSHACCWHDVKGFSTGRGLGMGVYVRLVCLYSVPFFCGSADRPSSGATPFPGSTDAFAWRQVYYTLFLS